jgi:hypothetical protein
MRLSDQPGQETQLGTLLQEELDGFPDQVAKLAADLVRKASRGLSESTLCEAFLSDLRVASKATGESPNGTA